MKTTRLFVLTVVSVAVLLLAACGGGGQQSGTPPGGDGYQTPAGAPERGGSGGQDASGADAKQANSSGEGSADFSVTTLEGERFDLSGGQDGVVALYFMAGW